MEIAAAISTILGLVALLVRQWFAHKQKQEENRDAINIQAEREALARNDGSLDAVAADQHDRVQQALCGDQRTGNDHGEEGNNRQPVQ